MATTLEMVIRAKYLSSGAGTLESELKNIKKALSEFKKSDMSIDVGKLLPQPGDFKAIESAIAGVTERLTQLRSAQSAAFGQGQEGTGSAIQQHIRDLESYKKLLETVATGTGGKTIGITDYIVDDGDVARFKSRSAEIKTELQKIKEAIAKATMSGDTTATSVFGNKAKALQQELAQLKAAIPKEDELKFNPENFLMSAGDISSVQSRIKGLEGDITRFKESAVSALASGNDKAAASFQTAARGAELQKSSLEKLIPTVEKAGFSIESLLTNKITRLGFGIFALQSSMRTFTELVKGMFSALLEGASSLDRSRSFEILLTGQGINVSGMTNKLEEASQGLITLDQAMSRTIQLSKAGFPDIAQNSDQLLKIATNAAIVSGDLSNVTVIYDKLIRGVIRGSPRLIDDADIILKLGDSNEKYAASLGTTVEKLTAAEKVRATYNAVIEEGNRINQLASQMDSEAIKVAKLKTEWEEFTEVLKESFAIMVIPDEAINSVDKMAVAVASFNDLDVEGRLALITQLATSTKGWAVLIMSSLAAIGYFIKGVYNQFAVLFSIVPKGLEIIKLGFDNAGTSVAYFTARMQGSTEAADKMFAAMVKNQKGIEGLSGELINIAKNPMAGFTDTLDSAIPKLDQMLEAAGFIQGENRTGFSPVVGGGGDEEIAAEQETTDELRKVLQERARMAEDIEYERGNKVRELNRDHADKMKDISRKLADSLADINQDLNDKLLDLARDREDKLADIAQDLQDKIADLEQDLADKLSDIGEDANDKRQDAQDDYHKGRIDAEEEYQKKINDIMRKYEASRLSALIDRDARALFEAEKTREQDLEDAKESAEEKAQEELEQLLEKLEDINKAEEEQRNDAIRSAEERRRDAQQAADRARRDAQQNYETARRDAQQDADRRLREAREDAAQERREAMEDRARARADMLQWYQDKIRDLQQHGQETLQEYSNQYSSINELTGQFMDTQMAAWSVFQQAMSGAGSSVWTGIGGTIDPGTGDEFPDWHNPANVYAGGRCNRGSSQITTGSDGRQYVCIGNSWQLFLGAGGASATTAGASMATGAGGGFLSGGSASGSSGGRIKVVLEGNGDDALTNIIKSGAYEAFLEIIN